MKKTLITSIITIILCISLISGSTYAIFTSDDAADISVKGANVEVSASVNEASLKIYSKGIEQSETDENGKLLFENKGSASFDGNSNLILDRIAPGDKATFTIDVENKSNIIIMYRVHWTVEGELSKALVATADGEKLVKKSSPWTEWDYVDGKEYSIEISVELPYESTDEFANKECKISFAVQAVQGNADLPAEWDGTTDTDWYNDTDTTFTLDDPSQLVGLAELVDGGNTFAGKTIVLDADMDLYCEDENGEAVCFEPIGSYRNEQVFSGTFDGNGHTIMNLNQNTWALDNGYYYGDLGLGFFGAVENATVKNLTLDGANISGESAICGVLVGVSGGECVYENITISNSKSADYQYYAGGIVGWASGNQKFIGCNVDSTTSIAAQWGDFDNSIGGMIGGVGANAEILFKDCNVACQIDSYNDVTSTYAYYAYRRAGMLIGNTGKTEVVTEENGSSRTVAIAPQLTCENVTVTYGEWANYTYCEFAGTSWPYVRVQEGVSNSAYSNPRYGHPTDAAGNVVENDNHVHNSGEDHQLLIVFDQLYGGGQGVYGNPAHEGVTVIYNNK